MNTQEDKLKRALLAIKKLKQQIQDSASPEPIAVVGVGCRFPGGVTDAESFWQLLANGKDAVGEVPKDRWDIDQWYDSDHDATGKMYTRWGGFLSDIETFDPEFFSISPREAPSIDPQQRLLLEVAWEAFENAGMTQASLRNSDTGVYVGICGNDYQMRALSDVSKIDAYTILGTAHSAIGGRLSYIFGLKGPNIAVDTACSSSLVSVHMAVQALRNNECALALAGGVNIVLSPAGSVYFSKLKALSPTGRCHTFSADADGFVRSEGCGMIVLKRLSDAQKNGDKIWGVIRGSAINQDGNSQGFTAPNGPSQQEVIRRALAQAGVEPGEVNYVEAHGTGTLLGDPIEVGALTAVLGAERPLEKPLYIGSVKTNIGHTEGAAGIAGIIKTLLSFEHDCIPKSIHFDSPSIHIPWEEIPVSVVAENLPWKRNGLARVAGVSSFGFSGTNAHVILEEAPLAAETEQVPAETRSAELITISGKKTAALKAAAGRLLQYIKEQPGIDLPGLACSLALTRTHFSKRAAFVCSDISQLVKSLEDQLADDRNGAPAHEGKVAFLFTGQGSQYTGMGRGLYDSEPVFRAALDECAGLLAPLLKENLIDVMFKEEHRVLLGKTMYAQPALFSLEYSLFKLWTSLGLQPDVLLGHSVGEVVAACVSGVFSLKDAITLIAARGRLMQALPENGAMASINASKDIVLLGLKGFEQKVAIAAENSPNQQVISGDRKAVEAVCAALQSDGIKSKMLDVSHAFHSALMEPMLEDFRKIISVIHFNSPQLPVISNVNGESGGNEMESPDYWVNHIRATVQFSCSIKSLEAAGVTLGVELGPHPVLTSLAQLNVRDDAPLQWIYSLKKDEDDTNAFLQNTGAWYEAGGDVNWSQFYRGRESRKIALPTYPFQRKKYWIEENEPVLPQVIGAVAVEQVAISAPSHSAVHDLSAVLARLRGLITAVLKMSEDEIPDTTPLLEIGADSIIVMELLKKIEREFRVKIAIRRIFEDLTTIKLLAQFITEQQVTSPQPAENIIVSQNGADHHGSNFHADGSADLNGRYLRLLEEQQRVTNELLQVLKGHGNGHVEATNVVLPKTVAPIQPAPVANGKPVIAVLPSFGVKEKTGTSDNQYLQEFIKMYCERTAKSKAFTDECRPLLADNRTSAGFRFSTKEMLYPIVGKNSSGSKFRDIDDNEYIDLTMGFGSNIFGHQPSFITEAIQSQLSDGIHIGPQSYLVKEVSSLFTSITGLDRVCFVNTGTEAVMTAIRLARMVTGRSKIVVFNGSYHGHFDGVLGAFNEDTHQVEPVAGGILPNMVRDLLVLEYCDDHSLEIIRLQAHEIAAVIVEPVQSRHLEIKPGAFLKQLRAITTELDVSLVFDEMITGFRILPGGAQAFFGIKADMATYGKIAGGGMPIGAIAGSRKYMDAIDGGAWQYGDQSFPKADTTFLAGTFSKHPLTMAAALATLRRIREIGEDTYIQLNEKTTQLAHALNIFFREEGVPVEVLNFGSLFRFTFQSNLDLLFYHLIKYGVYVWEGRNCFLSFAHTEQDLDKVISGVKQSIWDLKRNGFLPAGTPVRREIVVSTEDKLPLNTAQKQLWVLDKMNSEGGQAYIIHTNLELKGNLQKEFLIEAIREVVVHNQALQCCFDEDGLYHKFLKDSPLQVAEVDLTAWSGEEQLSKLEEYLNAQSNLSFALDRDRLIRFQLFRLNKGRHILAFQAHHIICDGQSTVVIIEQIAQLYNGKCAGQQVSLEESLSYVETLRLQQEVLASDEMREHAAFWVDQFKTDRNSLNFPFDHVPADEKRYAGASVTMELQKETMDGLKKIAQTNHCTSFMVLFSAYATWLHRLCNQEELVLGFPTNGRSFVEQGLDYVVGFYSHLLPVISQQRGDESFISYLKRTTSHMLSVFEHESFPYAELLQQIGAKHYENDLITTVFNVDKVQDAPVMTGLELSWLPQKAAYANMDFKMNLTDLGDRYVLECIYSSALFDAGTMEGYVGNFVTLLESLVKKSDANIAELELLSEAEKTKLLLEFNNTTADFPSESSLVDLFEQQENVTPAATAVVFEDVELSYRELNEKANQLAGYLKETYNIEAGNLQEQVVAIKLDRSEWMIITMLAVLKAGAAYIPIEPDFPLERVKYMLQDSGAVAIIDRTEIEKFISKQSTYGTNNSKKKVLPTKLAYIIYTSGSTGKPKGVGVEHRNMVNYINWFVMSRPAGDLGSSVLLSSYTFDGVCTSVYGTLLYGGSLHVLPQRIVQNPDLLLDYILRKEITFLKITPSYLRLAIQSPQFEHTFTNATKLALLVIGGEAIFASDLRRIASIRPDIQLMNHYGPTEVTVGMCAYLIPSDGLEDFIATPVIGAPISNTHVYILDDSRRLVPPGGVGEICASGAGVARGYINNHGRTAERFIADPFEPGQRLYRTGDLGRWKPDGSIQLIGRIDDQVKIRGYRIELGEIEQTLAQHATVDGVVVTTIKQESGDNALAAYIISAEPLNVPELRNWLAAYLPSYMVPAYFVRIDAIPLNASGKISRKQLPQPGEIQPAEAAVFVEPRNENEHLLGKVWGEVLKASQLSIRSNFYELGGDSIKSIQVASLVKQQGYNLKIEDILRYPVLEDMAQRMNTAVRKIDQSVVQGIVPMSPTQLRFFENSGIPQKHHFNQSVILLASSKIDKDALALCFDELVKHHDALRMVFRNNENNWEQENKNTLHKAYSVNLFDLRQRANAHELMLQRCESLQSSIRLEEGPLMKAAIFRFDDGDKLLIVIHHLVVDGVSWRILLHDLTTLYLQQTNGSKLELPQKTDSFKNWTESLLKVVQGRTLKAEVGFWHSVLKNQAGSFPVDHQSGVATPVSTRSVVLDTELTKLLQTQIHRAYRTEMNDVLLAGLAQAVKQVFNVAKSNILLEGHGREMLDEELDVTRTVGWFTSVFPFILNADHGADILSGLVQVKEDLRKIPGKGVGYGLLKYLGESFDDTFVPHIAFNYLGDFGFEEVKNGAEVAFIPVDEYHGHEEAAGNRANDSLLDITAMILCGKLKLSVAYRSEYDDATVQQLVEVWQKNLHSLVVLLKGITEARLTPSDLTFAGLSQQEFCRINAAGTVADVYPLSPLQEGMYFHWLSSPDSTMYSIQRAYRVSGENIGAAVIQKAFEWLVGRYDILRTSFDHEFSAGTLQVVLKSAEPNFKLIALPENLSPDDKAKALEEVKNADRDRGFDLRHGSQIRLMLVDLGTEGFELIWSYHHILMDGWCANILITEFDAAIEAFARDKQAPSAEVAPYARYIKWLGNVDQDASLNYWANYLEDYAEIAVPPYTLDQKPGTPFIFRQETLELKGDEYKELAALCHRLGITESVFIQSAWGYLLSKYNNTRDVVFGNVVSGRPKDLEGVSDMVGLFINTIPVRVAYDQQTTPARLLKKVQEEAIEGMAHHYINLSELQNRNALGQHLFNHILEFENYLIHEKTGDLSKTDIESFEHTHYNLAIVISHSEDRTMIHFNYNGGAFEPEGIRAMKGHLANVIGLFVQSPGQALSETSYLGEEEYNKIITVYNATEVSLPRGKTLGDLFTEQVVKTPDNIALIFNGRHLTYRELYEQAARLSNYLQQHADIKGKPVPIISSKSPEQIWGVLGILMAGGHYVPINGEWPEARINGLIEQVTPGIILVQPAYRTKIESTKAIVVDLAEATFRDLSNQHQPVSCSEDELAYIIFTSGSTGKPKGVMIDHRGAVNTLYDMNSRFSCTAADRVFGISDQSFDLSVFDIFGTLACGAALVVPAENETQNPAAWLSYIEKDGVTIWNSVPQLANLLIEEQEAQSTNSLEKMRLYLMSGDWIPVDLPGRIKSLSKTADVISLGGATEGSIWSIYYPVNEVDAGWKSIPYGYPLGNQEMYILDDTLAPCPVGITGGVFIGGKGVARGYFKDPQKTAHSFFYHPKLKRNLYRTGDLGNHHANGYINFLGRLDGQVKIRGYRIELGEIEATLQNHPSVETAVVVAIAPAGKRNARDKELVAYLVAKNELNLTKIREFLGQSLPEYMVPRHMVMLDKLPLTANGKVDKNALPAPGSGGTQLQENATPAHNDTERRLAAIWSEVLETPVDTIGVDQNFFEIGGHSIRAIRLISKINKAFEANIRIKDIFEHVSIVAQAQFIGHLVTGDFKNIQRIPGQADYEPSAAQRRLWVLCQFEETNIAYNIPAVYELTGELDETMIQEAFTQVIARHEILRTTFLVNQAGEVRQKVNAPETADLRIVHIDLTTNDAPEETLKAAVNAQKVIPFDLAAGPLLTASIYQMSAHRRVLFFNMHHIISDGWSVGVLMKELFECYNALEDNCVATLKELPIQYKDYAGWQFKQLDGESLEADRAYWLEQLAGELPVLEIPSDNVRPPVQTHQGAKVTLNLSADTTALLRNWVSALGGTLFMGLLAAVEAVLYRYTDQSDMIIGSPVAGRTHEDLENQIGLYMNTLPLRLKVEQGDSFLQLFQRVRETTLGAYDHQMYPFDELVDSLDVRRDLSRAALFDVMVDVQYKDHPENCMKLKGVEIAEYQTGHVTSKLDLTFDFAEGPDVILGTIEYNTDIYSAARVERMAHHLVNMLEACLQNPDCSVATVNYLSNDEEQLLLNGFNDTFVKRDKKTTVIDLFNDRVKTDAKAIAVRFREKELSYRQLDEISNQLGHYLVAQYGTAADDRIAIMLDRSEWMIIAVLAVLKSGQAYVPIDTAYPESRITYMQENSQCKACINAELIGAFQRVSDQYAKTSLQTVIQPQHLAYMIYTSGSTGKPKGVMVEHHNLVNIALAWKDTYRLEATATNLLQMASISFDVFFGDVCRALLTGKMIICPDDVRLDWENLYRLLAENQVNIFEATPGLILPFMDYVYKENKEIGFLKTLIIGSDAFDIRSYKDLQEHFGPAMRIINSYGVTEAAIDSSWFDSDDMPGNYSGNTPIGKPFDNTEFYIVDKNGRLVPPGVPGELWIGGAGVARGYWREPALTNERFIDNPFKKGGRVYRTGDTGRWLANGVMEFGGRYDDQVKVRGYRVELGEIKAALQDIPDIEDAVVITVGTKEKVLVAYWKGGKSLNKSDIRKRLAAALPGYMVPSWFVQMDRIPLTPNGKVDRKALPAPEGFDMGVNSEYIRPVNAREQKLVTLWSEVLKLPADKIGVTNNFFELGGHSLKAIRLLTLIQQQFEVQFKLNELFTHVTIEEQSKLIVASGKKHFGHIPVVALQDSYPLSSAQRRLWVLCQHQAANIAYTIQGALRLEGTLDINALESAFASVVSRHEILRTVFRMNPKGEVRQVVLSPDTGFDLIKSDLRDHDKPVSELDNLMVQSGNKPFDLANGPLLKAAIFRIEENVHIFFCNMHHIISDGWSIEVLIKEVFQFYNGAITGIIPVLKDLPVQYKDYAGWQQGQLTHDHLQYDRTYWLEQFSGELPVLALTPDYPRPRIHSYYGATVSGTLSPAVFTAFNELLKKENATLFMGLLAVINSLLHRYTHQDDFIIGTPIAGREHVDLEDQIGFYINTLALRTRMDADDTFISLLNKVKEVTLGAYDHQAYPFDTLTDELNLNRDVSRSVLFDVMVVLQNNDNLSEGMSLENVEVSDYDTEQVTSKFDWLFNFIETKDGARYIIEYNGDIYAEERMLKVQEHMARIIDSVLADPQQNLGSLSYLSALERDQLLVEFNDTKADYPENVTVLDLFEQQVKQRPDDIAVVFDGKAITYKELNQQANQLGEYLVNKYGIETEDRIAVKLERSPSLIIALLGVLKSGGAYVPVDPEFPAGRADFILRDSECKALIDADEFETFTKSKHEYSTRNKKSKLTATSLMYVIYTSGSTGQPKGCMLEHKGIVNRIEWMWKHYRFEHTDVILQKTTFTFDVSVWELFMPLAWGCRMVLAQKEDVYEPERMLNLIAEQGITCMHFVPGMLSLFVATLEQRAELLYKLTSLRAIITSGEALPAGLVHRWFKIAGVPVYNLYGPTEASIDVTYFDIHEETQQVLIGKPIANTQLFILHDDGLVPVGVPGEICIAGDGLARGYLNRPELTAKSFIDNPFAPGTKLYKTGDLGRWLPDGSIEFIGRKDYQVKIRGYRIELQEIELALQQQATVDEVVVIDIATKNGERELTAYIVASSPLNTGDLRAALLKVLPQYMVPAYFVQLEKMPLTANGKLDRKALPLPQDAAVVSRRYVPPVNEVQQALVNIWAEVLERKPGDIGILDNFFEIGGHSLKAVTTLARVEAAFHVKVELFDFFGGPDIDNLSKLIEIAEDTEAKTDEPVQDQTHESELTF